MRKENRRNTLTNVALDCFEEKGFEATTINDIIHKAQCGKGTFYKYFKNKDELLEVLIENHINKLYKSIMNHLDINLSLFENLEKAIYEYIKVLRKDKRLIKLVEEVRVSKAQSFLKKFFDKFLPVYDFFCKKIREEVDSGRIISISPEIFMTSIYGSIHMLAFREIKLGKKVSPDDVKEILLYFYHGIWKRS